MVERIDADVVVVGGGAAGASAAIEAATAGLEVVLLEAAGAPGGASAMSGGLIYLGGGTRLQVALGFEDDADNMSRFLREALGPGVDEEKLQRYCEDSPGHYDWLVAQGVPFREAFWDEPTYEPWDDSGLMFSGGERSHPFDVVARPAPRGHCPQAAGTSREGAGGGYVLLHSLVARAVALGVRIEVSTVARTLEVDASGRVCGVVARHMGADRLVAARRGVVLASGGFGFNEDLVRAHAPKLAGTAAMGVDHHDGTMLQAAIALGAATARMDAAEAAVPVPPAILHRGIVVDRAGTRFVNEDTYMGRVGQQILHARDTQAWVVFDGRTFDEAEPWRGRFVPAHVCETVEELAAELGLPADALAETVRAHDAAARRGSQDAQGKQPPWLRPLEPPLGAAPCGPLRTFTLGGLRSNVDGAVLEEDGAPIPGLYAAGRVTSGLPAWGYVSGASLGDCTYFGRRAGRAVAAR